MRGAAHTQVAALPHCRQNFGAGVDDEAALTLI